MQHRAAGRNPTQAPTEQDCGSASGSWNYRSGLESSSLSRGAEKQLHLSQVFELVTDGQQRKQVSSCSVTSSTFPSVNMEEAVFKALYTPGVNMWLLCSDHRWIALSTGVYWDVMTYSIVNHQGV
ncbi:unnamed protein product [Pleuronectes platessa]|uniref:Uncharacterized protein n=1 Tax=Pleuronectes platessa TaxID=8262 RepID=A0A9N7VQI3_PLEPL|nr:unnamed protein product [Pleuronectes platessa]